MTLKAVFNNKYEATKDNDYVLSIYYSTRAGSVYHAFDFMTRTLITRTGSNDGGLVVTPFSQVDGDTLNTMREKLIELEGKPPELTPASPADTTPAQKLHL